MGEEIEKKYCILHCPLPQPTGKSLFNISCIKMTNYRIHKSFKKRERERGLKRCPAVEYFFPLKEDPEFRYKYPHKDSNELQFQGIWCPLLAFVGSAVTWHTDTWRQKLHTQKIKIKYVSRKELIS